MIYISDLDMTLLNSKMELSSFARKNINKLINKGINFTIASARSVSSIKPILAGVDLKLPIIEFNGAFISDLKTGEHQVINDIDKSTIDYIYKTLTSFKKDFFLSTFDGAKDKLYCPKATNLGEEWYFNDRKKKKDPRLTETLDIKEHFKEKVICFTIIDLKEKLEPIYKELCKYQETIEMHFQENQYSKGWFWLTVHSNLATKDQAIRNLLKLCHLGNAEVTVFGDNTNDIKMFRYATKAVAVENACLELREVADTIIGSNEEDSVVKYIATENDIELEK